MRETTTATLALIDNDRRSTHKHPPFEAAHNFKKRPDR